MSEYSITTDFYPYHRSINIISQLDWWTDHKRQDVHKNKPTNYSLDYNLVNSLGYSFQYKLKDGCFNFIYNGNELVSFGGLLIKDKRAYLHRFATNPKNHSQHLGIVSKLIIPTHLYFAKNKGCLSYNITFNKEREKLYNYFKDKKYLRSRFVKVKGGEEFLQHFEYKGLIKFFGVDQYLMTIDLSIAQIKNMNIQGDYDGSF